jgi:hypothetical protein
MMLVSDRAESTVLAFFAGARDCGDRAGGKAPPTKGRARGEARAEARIAMPEIYDDRRQEPRFTASGEVRFIAGDKSYRADILDMSLNGVKITRPEGFDVPKGQRFRIELLIPGTDAFNAEVMLVHAEPLQLGVEFYDMPPRDFSLLAALIEQFLRLRRTNGAEKTH